MSMLKKWFRENKHDMGFAALLISMVFSEVVIGIWEVDEEWIVNTARTFQWIALACGAAGSSHNMLNGLKKKQ